MKKQELIAAVAERAGLTKKDACSAINAFEQVVFDELAAGGAVKLTGFGSFGVTERKERNGVNPKTQEAIVIPAKKAPKFKAGSDLKKAVKGK